VKRGGKASTKPRGEKKGEFYLAGGGALLEKKSNPSKKESWGALLRLGGICPS